MQLIAGIFYHFVGGFASGSFYIPYKKVKDWTWESFWIIDGLFSWTIVPRNLLYDRERNNIHHYCAFHRRVFQNL